MLRTSLELSGRPYEITVVASAEEALLELQRGPVDLVVTDLRLPGMSGLELLARIRQTNPQLRALLITGQPTPDVRAQAQALGVVAFLPKPVGTNLFLEAVDRALRPGSEVAPAELTGERALLAEKLMTMRRELGARASFLVHRRGEYVMRAGEIADSQLDAVLGRVMESFSQGLEASVAMGAESPRDFYHIDGQPYRLYLTNVGRDYALLIGDSVTDTCNTCHKLFGGTGGTTPVNSNAIVGGGAAFSIGTASVRSAYDVTSGGSDHTLGTDNTPAPDSVAIQELGWGYGSFTPLTWYLNNEPAAAGTSHVAGAAGDPGKLLDILKEVENLKAMRSLVLHDYPTWPINSSIRRQLRISTAFPVAHFLFTVVLDLLPS